MTTTAYALEQNANVNYVSEYTANNYPKGWEYAGNLYFSNFRTTPVTPFFFFDIYKSPDGITWTPLDTANAPTVNKYAQYYPQAGGNKVYFVYSNGTNHIFTVDFNLDTGLFGTPSAQGPVVRSGEKAFDFVVRSDGSYVIAYLDQATFTAKYVIYNGAWGSATTYTDDVTQHPLIASIGINDVDQVMLPWADQPSAGHYVLKSKTLSASNVLTTAFTVASSFAGSTVPTMNCKLVYSPSTDEMMYVYGDDTADEVQLVRISPSANPTQALISSIIVNTPGHANDGIWLGTNPAQDTLYFASCILNLSVTPIGIEFRSTPITAISWSAAVTLFDQTGAYASPWNGTAIVPFFPILGVKSDGGVFAEFVQSTTAPSVDREFVLAAIFPGPVLACPVVNTGVVGALFDATLQASGGTPPYTFAITGGSLPPGIVLNTSTGTLSGTPITVGVYPYTAQVTDANGATATADCSITITTLTAACPVAGTATIGQAYTGTVTASGGTPPYTYTATGLPSGLTINASTGVISGTPTMLGTFLYTVTITDANGIQVQIHCQIVVSPQTNPVPLTPPHTLRYQIPQKRWFPHAYHDRMQTHYLDEPAVDKPNAMQLLMPSGSVIYISGGNTDNLSAINSRVTTPSNDGGDERLQKLFIDQMFDADGTGTLSAFIQYNNQTQAGPVISVALAGTRVQSLENISSLADLDLFRNIATTFGWTGGPDGPRIYAVEPSAFSQPYLSKFFITQFITFSYPGWKAGRRMYPALVSNAPVLFTIKTQDDRVYGPYTIPSTGGQFKIVPMIMDHGVKDLAFAIQLDGQNSTFALFPSDFVCEFKGWADPEFILLALFKT